MFEATGSAAYLDKALELVSNVINNAIPSKSLGAGAYRDGYSGWVSQRSDVRGCEVPLFESYCWRYVTRLLTAMRNNKTVFANPTYRSKYDWILAFTEKNIFDKWYARGANANIYRQNTHMASHWAYISLHLRRHTSNTTRQARCDAIRSRIDSAGLPNYGGSLKGQLRLGSVASGAYYWDDAWGSTSRPGQDVAHGNAVIAYVVEGRDYGRTWTAADMAAFSATLTKIVTPRRPTYVDGTGTGTGWLADGFVKLGRFSASVQIALESHDVQGQGQYMAAMAANARRLAM